MPTIPRTALLALFLGLLAPVAAATCPRCADVGHTACTAHTEAEHALEVDAKACSHVNDCTSCGGTLKVDCPDCAHGEEALAAERDRRAQWQAEQQEHWDRLDHRFPIGRSAHFRLFWSGGRLVENRRKLSEHESMHVVLRRLEKAYDEFLQVTGAQERDFTTEFHVLVWSRAKHQQVAALHYARQGGKGATGVKLLGGAGVYSLFLDPNVVDTDESAEQDVHRALRHNVAHLMLANVWDGRWPGELAGGWIDEGLAHWFEDRLDGRCTNFCYTEQNTVQGYKGGRWRGPARKMATQRDRPQFVDVARKRTDELTREEHVLVWSYCEFLIGRSPEGFGAVCRAVKSGGDLRAPMTRYFGFSPLEFDENWEKHVRETYPKR